MKGVLILAHGSRQNETENTLDEIELMVKENLPEVYIETAYLQFREKTLENGMKALIEKGVDDIKIVPYFLFNGVHIEEDIPGEINDFLKGYPEVKVEMGKTLGADYRLADIVTDRINEVLL